MQTALLVAGTIAQVITQRMTARGQPRTWVATAILFLVLTPATLLVGDLTLELGAGRLMIGLGAGLFLYGATQGFLYVVRDWRSFRTDTERVYRLRTTLPLGPELLLGAWAAVGEELFWRGLGPVALSAWLGPTEAMLTALVLFIAVNAATLSRPVIAGAIVGGGVWAALALWPTAGLAAAVVSHATWTILMIAVPGQAARAETGDRAIEA